jgi:hypothetical protein
LAVLQTVIMLDCSAIGPVQLYPASPTLTFCNTEYTRRECRRFEVRVRPFGKLDPLTFKRIYYLDVCTVRVV